MADFRRTQDQSLPRIGDWVLPVGNPFGLGGTVTVGIVSARGRDIGAGPYDDFIQIDAPVVLHHIADICGRVHCMTVDFQNDVQELLSSH